MAVVSEHGDWESLTSAAQEIADTILLNNVLPVAEDIFRRHIQTDIYDKYSPQPGAWVHGTTYQRRHVLERSLDHCITDGDTLWVYPTASASHSIIAGHSVYGGAEGFLKLLETGKMGIWKRGFPRPVVSLVQKEYDTSSMIRDAIRRGVKEYIG